MGRSGPDGQRRKRNGRKMVEGQRGTLTSLKLEKLMAPHSSFLLPNKACLRPGVAQPWGYQSNMTQISLIICSTSSISHPSLENPNSNQTPGCSQYYSLHLRAISTRTTFTIMGHSREGTSTWHVPALL